MISLFFPPNIWHRDFPVLRMSSFCRLCLGVYNFLKHWFSVLWWYFFNVNRQWDCRTRCQCCGAEMQRHPFCPWAPAHSSPSSLGSPACAPQDWSFLLGQISSPSNLRLTSCCTWGANSASTSGLWWVWCHRPPCGVTNTDSGWDSLKLKASRDTTPAPPCAAHRNA